MMYMAIFNLSIICSSIFLFMKHPLAMGLMLLIQTTIICATTGLFMKTFWFSYVLFLIFIGGMLVLFIYVTSLASNEMFNLSMKIFFFMICSFLFMNFSMIFLDKNLSMMMIESMDMMNLNFLKSYYLENNLLINKLYNFPINLITIILMIYLFLTLVVIVKITDIFEGPLRPQN